MEREANYIAVGGFVVLMIAMATVFVIWYTGSRDQRDYNRYEIYFQGSVSGLNAGSTVRYLGVDVGRVKSIGLDPRAADRVQVVADIDAKAPVSHDTIASLSLQGVTGLLYIDLERDQHDKPAMPDVPSQRYPVIRSVQSDFDLLVSSMPELFSKAAIAADRITKLISDENIALANDLLANIHKAGGELPGTMREARNLLVELQGTAREIQTAAAGVRAVTDSAGPDLAQTLEHVREVSENLSATSKRLDQFVADNQSNIGRFTDQGLSELHQLIRDGRQAAQDFRELTRSLKDNPSQLIYQPNYAGVEIAR